MSVTLFANIFPHSVGCPFVYGFFCYAEVSEFDLVPFFIFLFISFMRWIENDIAAGQRLFCLYFPVEVL